VTVYHYRVEEVSWIPWRQLFDLDEENNLPTWFSGFLLTVTSAAVWICAYRKRLGMDPWWMQWYMLAAGFLLLSVDEIAGLHETVKTMIEMSWAIPAEILALLVGLTFVPFLLSLPTTTRNWFIVSGCIYVAGAVGMEIVGDPMDADTMIYNLTTVVEEGMEMAGIIVFLFALTTYMRPDDDAPIALTVGFKQ